MPKLEVGKRTIFLLGWEANYHCNSELSYLQVIFTW